MGKRLATILRQNEPLRQFLEASLNRPVEESDPEYGEFGSISDGDIDALGTRFVDLARDLESAGVGTFVVGRRGHPSRLEWRRDVREIAREIFGAGSEVTGPGSMQDGPHLVNLPRGRVARLELPAELTEQEADIVIAYLRALVPRVR